MSLGGVWGIYQDINLSWISFGWALACLHSSLLFLLRLFLLLPLSKVQASCTLKKFYSPLSHALALCEDTLSLFLFDSITQTGGILLCLVIWFSFSLFPLCLCLSLSSSVMHANTHTLAHAGRERERENESESLSVFLRPHVLNVVCRPVPGWGSEVKLCVPNQNRRREPRHRESERGLWELWMRYSFSFISDSWKLWAAFFCH